MMFVKPAVRWKWKQRWGRWWREGWTRRSRTCSSAPRVISVIVYRIVIVIVFVIVIALLFRPAPMGTIFTISTAIRFPLLRFYISKAISFLEFKRHSCWKWLSGLADKTSQFSPVFNQFQFFRPDKSEFVCLRKYKCQQVGNTNSVAEKSICLCYKTCVSSHGKSGCFAERMAAAVSFRGNQNDKRNSQ